MFKDFGRIGNRTPAENMIFLYGAEGADLTCKTYTMGQHHWVCFYNLHPSIPSIPFATQSPDPVALSLCLFGAYLASRSSIRRYITVRGYMCMLSPCGGIRGACENASSPPCFVR